jgi:hypothetical protein
MMAVMFFSLTRRTRFNPHKYFYVYGTRFCWKPSEFQDLVRLEGFLRSVLQLVITVKVVPSLLILSTVMMEALISSETSVHRRAAWRHITEDGILPSRLRYNLKSY